MSDGSGGRHPAERLRLTDCGDHRVDQAWALPV